MIIRLCREDSFISLLRVVKAFRVVDINFECVRYLNILGYEIDGFADTLFHKLEPSTQTTF